MHYHFIFLRYLQVIFFVIQWTFNGQSFWLKIKKRTAMTWIPSATLQIFWSVFSRIWTEYGKIRSRKKSLFGHFLRSAIYDLDRSNKKTIILGEIVILSNLKTVLGEKVGHLISHSFRLTILEKRSVQFLSKSDGKISGSLKEKKQLSRSYSEQYLQFPHVLRTKLLSFIDFLVCSVHECLTDSETFLPLLLA